MAGDNVPESRNLNRDLYREIDELKEAFLELQRKGASENTKPSARLRRSAGEISSDLDLQSRSCDVSASPGPPGPSGPPGSPGLPGRDGRDGRDAPLCKCKNHDGPTTPEPPVNPPGRPSGGAVFVRWGLPECPSSSRLLYSGIVGGAHYTHKGSGANYLCLPEEPIYDEPQEGTSGQNRALVYGAEYETNTYGQWNHLHNSNVPCAVCWARNRPSLVVVPARNECPGSGWTKEFSGYLVAAHYNHQRSEFVCMDKNPEVIPRSAHDANGALFYVAEGRCGASGSGLPCGPYVNGYELTCAVCTR
ncbi:Short-chain collagen C4 [Holothuria leucospilota]|uniref:Short-chain collagen C4 n=1 Tax=Holothuria leucospilota TaxID=206669 RepID=A0A9Q0YG30_HOLLE|nr:Short-chain collagen C4 [Holothuria leucospilota]